MVLRKGRDTDRGPTSGPTWRNWTLLVTACLAGAWGQRHLPAADPVDPANAPAAAARPASQWVWQIGQPAEEDDPNSNEDNDRSRPMQRFMERFRRPGAFQRLHDTIKEAFREVSRPASHGTVEVLCDDRVAALGALVDGDGHVLTKASELQQARMIECRLSDGRRMKAMLVGLRADHDLAMLKVEAADLRPLEWITELPQVGAWLVTPGIGELPVSIGVASAAVREIAAPRAVLGLLLEEHPKGAKVGRVMPGSGAEEAGVKSGDVVETCDDEPVTRDSLIERVKMLQPGDKVRLKLVRDGKTEELEVELRDLNALAGGGERIDFQRQLGGPLSRRRAGFSKVMQHDTVLRPNECGGPVVNLDGKCVGINIARASREASFALPSQVILPLLDELRSGELAPPENRATLLAQRLEQLQRTFQQWTDRLTKCQADVRAAESRVADAATAPDARQAAEDSLPQLRQLESDARSEIARLTKSISDLKAKQENFVNK